VVIGEAKVPLSRCECLEISNTLDSAQIAVSVNWMERQDLGRAGPRVYVAFFATKEGIIYKGDIFLGALTASFLQTVVTALALIQNFCSLN